MRIGIVGSEAAKFTHETEAQCRGLIRMCISPGDVIISGGCHLGGVDSYAIEEARKLGNETIEHLPEKLEWDGYKKRNMKIAEDSDKVFCFTVSKLPTGYRGMRFPLCYHCKLTDHVKSGGCWTVKYAKKIGKEGVVYIVDKLMLAGSAPPGHLDLSSWPIARPVGEPA